MRTMGYREYLTLVAHFSTGQSEPVNQKPKKSGKKSSSKKSTGGTSSEEVTFGPPVFEELTPLQKAKLLWAGRLGLKDIAK